MKKIIQPTVIILLVIVALLFVTGNGFIFQMVSKVLETGRTTAGIDDYLFFDNIEGVLILSVLSGSILGFLIRNFKPALYIMGDCGTYFLGFCLSTGAIYFSSENNQNSVSIIYLLVLFSLPILDMIFVLFNRIIGSFNPFMPDNNHIHHRMVRAKFEYNHIIFFIYFYSVLSALFANIFIT